MFVRPNPALPPQVRGGIAEAHAHILCRAAVEEVLYQAHTDALRLCALHRLDKSTISELLSRCVRLATHGHSVWLTHLRDVPIARLGSGRSHARDCGGRIASRLDEMVDRRLSPNYQPHLIEQDRLWRLAHPVVARAIVVTRGMITCGEFYQASHATGLRQALAPLTPCDHAGAPPTCGPVCMWVPDPEPAE